jgi:methylglutaconyl-CoA hydratase
MVISEVVNNSGIIKLNRPEKRNALNPELISSVKQSLSIFIRDENIKNIIITGEGKAFCAGADLDYLKSLNKNSVVENKEDSLNIADLFLKLYECPKPLIAAVNGPAIAGGCGLASVCDYVIAHSQYAGFGYSEVKIGFIPAIVSIFLIRRTGEAKARQLLISGDILDAQSALQYGLADYISDDPLNKALEIALRLENNSFSSISMTKQMIRDISSLPVKQAVDYCIALNVVSRSSDDFRKGLNSFLNKG